MPPATPFTDQVTVVANVPVPFTVAANCCVCPAFNVTALGVTVTLVTAFAGGGLGGFGAALAPPPQATVRIRAERTRTRSRERDFEFVIGPFTAVNWKNQFRKFRAVKLPKDRL